jgi:hypothetical protein
VAEVCEEAWSGGAVPDVVELVLVLGEGGLALVDGVAELVLVLEPFVLFELSVLCCSCDEDAGFAFDAFFEPQITDLQPV